MLDHAVLFTKLSGQYGHKEVVYSRHYLLTFQIFIADTSAD